MKCIKKCEYKEKKVDIKLEQDERLDDLGINNLKIIQNKKGFCFGIDSVLLVNFAKKIKKNSMVMDLGTGTGIIPVLLSGKVNYKKAIAVEIQEEVANMAKRTVALNNLQEKIEILNKDIKDLKGYIEKGKFDVVISNPPYKKKNAGVVNINEKLLISRHEITANLEDFISVAKDMLKDKGEFYMVHKPERLVDILVLMRQYKIEPKLVRFVCNKVGQDPVLVLIKGVKNANSFLRVENNLYIYKDNGEYSEEIGEIYGE